MYKEARLKWHILPLTIDFTEGPNCARLYFSTNWLRKICIDHIRNKLCYLFLNNLLEFATYVITFVTPVTNVICYECDLTIAKYLSVPNYSQSDLTILQTFRQDFFIVTSPVVYIILVFISVLHSIMFT